MGKETSSPARGTVEASLPGAAPETIGGAFRYALSRFVVSVLVRVLFRVRVEGRDRLSEGPALVCFNHQSWTDPFVLLATLPSRPRVLFFGPKEEDMTVGGRNRLMIWTGAAVPYKPGKNDLLDVTRKVQGIFAAGSVLAIAGEGRIHAGEGELLPLSEGAAFFALRSSVPILPVAINGTSWLAFGRSIRVRIGAPLLASGRPTREAVAGLTADAWEALHALCQGYPDPEPPPPGSLWARFTELFNEWPEGGRPPTPPARD